MKIFVAKIERKSEKWGGGTKVTTEFFAVRAQDEAQALSDFKKMLDTRASILYTCEESNIPAEDVKAYQDEN